MLFFLTTPVLANVVSIGFDKPEYLIAPDVSQQIYAELKDGAGAPTKFTDRTTYVDIIPGSATGQISKKISSPVFATPGAKVSITIAKGDYRKSFLYKDSTLGTTTLIATSSGLLNGQLKITIGFPPPPPPPLPPPAPVSAPKPKPVVAVVPQIIPKPLPPTPAPQLSPEPDKALVETSSAEIVKLDIESLLNTSEPEVLAAEDTAKEEEPSFFDELFFWLEQFIFDKIWL